MLTRGTMRGCGLTSLVVCINDKFCDIRERNVTIRSEIWTTNIHFLGFRDIREWVTVWRLILRSLGCSILVSKVWRHQPSDWITNMKFHLGGGFLIPKYPSPNLPKNVWKTAPNWQYNESSIEMSLRAALHLESGPIHCVRGLKSSLVIGQKVEIGPNCRPQLHITIRLLRGPISPYVKALGLRSHADSLYLA